MSTIRQCDWCHKEIEGSCNTVSINGQKELDCCTSCIKNVNPKPKVGRPRRLKAVVPEVPA
jgi:hypothetical protein